MPTNREWAAAFGVLLVAWSLLGHTAGRLVGLSVSALWIGFAITLLALIFTPAVMIKARWTALGAVIVGAINIIIRILGVVRIPLMVFGQVVSIVLALLFTYFSFRAYKEK